MIDLSTWPRQKHFEMFSQFDYPHFNICSKVDITATLHSAREIKQSINTVLIYCLARAANELPEFRLRIRNGQVIEHEQVQPSASVLSKDNLFSFCTMPYDPDYQVFSPKAEEMIQFRLGHPTLDDEPGQDDLLFMSCIPWIDFTSISHPIHMHPADSIPRITWGKFTTGNGRTCMPVSVQVHHGLMDGYHVGQYYQILQELLDSPANWMGRA
jgi:chloramphenicol O-acetyltransferase type A